MVYWLNFAEKCCTLGNTCIGCHDPHTLQVKVEECQACHTGMQAAEDARDIRMASSLVDYDGDGDMEEGIYYEVEGLQETLLAAMQAYADEVAGTAIVYDAATHPYFFIDTNGNGTADPDEANGDNRFNAWTPRLLKAAYNYQVSKKDPGGFVHGGKYIIQLLADSLADVNSGLSTPVEAADVVRNDHGHFAGSQLAFRDWDADGAVPAACVKCHTAEGLPMFLSNNATVSVPPSNGLECSTCHSDLTTFALYEVEQVKFPSGAMLAFEDSAASNLCLQCHQGRESTVSVNTAIKDKEVDAVTEGLGFRNIHYFAAGATLFGTEAKGAYEYDGKEYVGQFVHVPNFDTCIECHDAHALKVEVEGCGGCHAGVETEADLVTIRLSTEDYDGDGDTEEGIAGEIETMREVLYAAMQKYSAGEAGSGIVYSSASYPYFFNDTNGNGEADPDEANRENAYSSWTPRLLQAAYNYQYATKDPGGFAHNAKYILQVLYDSLEAIGADTGDMVRPS